MKKIGIQWLIHGFALLHLAVTSACLYAGIPDSLILTVLTMAQTVIICLRESLTVEVTVISILLVNILGFVLGNLGAQLMLEGIPVIAKRALTTFLVTELLGWALYAFAHRYSPSGAAAYERNQSWKRNKWWLLVAIAVIFGLRVLIDFTFTGNFLRESSALGILIIVTVLSLAYMVNFAINMQREAAQQRTRRHQAEFRYMTLKHQVNPHFLFNCLNVLDSIVQEGTRGEASAYIQKMAAIYRYLMQQEGKRLVPVAEELAFGRTYRDLMGIRFPEGLEVEDRIGDDAPAGFIVPCTIQLLLENALKHNAISPENPLVITLSCDGQALTVRNKLIPKASKRPSTGIGLQYIRNQYRDIAAAEILVEKTQDSFAVTVPILEETEQIANFAH